MDKKISLRRVEKIAGWHRIIASDDGGPFHADTAAALEALVMLVEAASGINTRRPEQTLAEACDALDAALSEFVDDRKGVAPDA